MSNYLKKNLQVKLNPPQSDPLDERQIKNSAGGYVYPVTEWVMLDRFLILGTEGGSYYATEKKLTLENVDNVKKCVAQDGKRVVDRVVEISHSGRSPKNDPALLVLALCAASDKEEVRTHALANLHKVARIGTHLFHFLEYVNQLRGWGRGLKTTIQDWYLRKKVDSLTEQVVKYQSRDGWSHRDVLRLCHAKSKDPIVNSIFKFAVKKELDETTPRLIQTYITIQSMLGEGEDGKKKTPTTKQVKEVSKLIIASNLTREMLPTEFLNYAEIWDALLQEMPMTAMIRNLGNMSKVDLVTPMSNAEMMIKTRLHDQDKLKKARVHPIQVLSALLTYKSGRGVRGKGEWAVNQPIVDALEDAYYLSFGNVVPTGKRFYLGVDVSGSMDSGEISGIPGLSPRMGAAAMAMVTVRIESNYCIRGFCDEMVDLHITAKDTIANVWHKTNIADFGGTDCALPMIDALKNKIPVDIFIILTDSETWAGNIHPSRALTNYRKGMGIPAKQVVVGMTSVGFSIADPTDAGMMDVIGFDTATPQLISDFAVN